MKRLSAAHHRRHLNRQKIAPTRPPGSPDQTKRSPDGPWKGRPGGPQPSQASPVKNPPGSSRSTQTQETTRCVQGRGRPERTTRLTIHHKRQPGTAHRPKRVPHGLARHAPKSPDCHPTRPLTANGERSDHPNGRAKPEQRPPARNVMPDPKPTARRGPATCGSESVFLNPGPRRPPQADGTSADDPKQPKTDVPQSLDEQPAGPTSRHHSRVLYPATPPAIRGVNLPPEGSDPTPYSRSKSTRPADPEDAELAPRAASTER